MHKSKEIPEKYIKEAGELLLNDDKVKELSGLLFNSHMTNHFATQKLMEHIGSEASRDAERVDLLTRLVYHTVLNKTKDSKMEIKDLIGNLREDIKYLEEYLELLDKNDKEG